jgi:hypothetical protein
MTPVTGAVPDGDEKGPVLSAGAFKRVRAPGIPIHGIATMLEQVVADLA